MQNISNAWPTTHSEASQFTDTSVCQAGLNSLKETYFLELVSFEIVILIRARKVKLVYRVTNIARSPGFSQYISDVPTGG